MQRSTLIVALVGLLLLAAGAFVGWQKMNDLSGEIAGLNDQVGDLQGRLAEAQEKAARAQERADKAQVAARQAAEEAGQAAERAEESDSRAQQAEAARLTAEEIKAQEEAARLAAEEKARQAAEARALAEEERRAQAQLAADAEKKRIEAAKEAEAAQREARRAQEEVQRIREQMELELNRMERALGRIANTRREALGLVMTLDNQSVEFDFNKADLRPESREVLSRIGGVLLTFDNYSIQIFGHTDDVDTEEYNQALSERRAKAVQDYLVEMGIDPAVMKAIGMGETEPLVQGTDPESRQRNRRVELAIVFSEGEYGKVLAEEGDGG